MKKLSYIGWFVCGALMLQGCGVKLVYNNLDRLIRWQINDYIDMTDEQRSFYDEEIAVLLYWHRTTQLPEYAAYLETMSDDLDGSIQIEEVRHLYETLRTWGDRIEKRAKPMTVGLMTRLTDEQVRNLPDGFKKTNNDLLEDEDGKTAEESRAQWVKGFRGVGKRFIGKFSSEQLDYVTAQSQFYQPERHMWVEYRLRWQQDFMALLEVRHDPVAFEAGFGELVRLRDTYWSDEYRAVSDANEQLTLETLAGVIMRMSDKQRERMREKLDGLAVDFWELVEEAPSEGPRALTVVDQ
jgi:hypothetical protein